MVIYGRGGKGDYGYLQRDVICLNHMLLSPVLERHVSSRLDERRNTKDDGCDEMPCEDCKDEMR